MVKCSVNITLSSGKTRKCKGKGGNTINGLHFCAIHMKMKLKTNYIIHKVNTDGECLFNAIAFGILLNTKKQKPSYKEYKTLAKELRKIATDVLMEKIETNDVMFTSAMAAEYRNSTTKSDKDKAMSYVRKMRRACQWGGQIELIALSDEIHQRNFKGVQVVNSNMKNVAQMATNINSSKKGKLLKIRLKNIRNGGSHFDYVSKKNQFK